METTILSRNKSSLKALVLFSFSHGYLLLRTKQPRSGSLCCIVSMELCLHIVSLSSGCLTGSVTSEGQGAGIVISVAPQV